MVRLSIKVILTDGKKRETGSYGGGGRLGLSSFDDLTLAQMTDKAITEARDKLPPKKRRPAYAGGFRPRLGGHYPARSGRARLGR